MIFRGIIEIGNEFKTAEEFLEKVSHLYIDDIVFFNPTKENYFHTDCAKYSWDVSTENEKYIEFEVNSLGCNWDDLNEEEGYTPKDITLELLSESTVDNYVIFTEINSELFCDFKLKSLYICPGNDIIEIKIPNTAKNITKYELEH